MSENNQFQRNYTLQQHTMLLHFQADNNLDGRKVCLRASEVKPKLDRYLTRILGGNSKVPTEWIQQLSANKTDISYRYQMRIVQKEPNTARITDDIPKIFYGNMSNGENESRNKFKKRGVYFPNGLVLTITCFIPDLLLKIDEIIGDFFIATNFGTMQGKGFGSFTVKEKRVDQVVISKVLKKHYRSGKCYVIGNNRVQSPTETEIFSVVKQVYSVMKSGQNVVDKNGNSKPEKYVRSFIYEYMHSKHELGNEKAFMKSTGMAPKRTTHEKNDDHEDGKQFNLHEFRYVRSLLGIGESQNWIEPKDEQRSEKPRRENITLSDCTYKSEDGDKEKKDENKTISRYASPVFFKIIDGAIYMCADTPDSKIYDRKFCFENKGYLKCNNPDECPRYGEKRYIKTLTSQEGSKFNMADFMDLFMRYYNQKLKERKFTRWYIIRSI